MVCVPPAVHGQLELPLRRHAVLYFVQGKELEGEAEGILCIKKSWPSILRTVYGDHKRFEETYFSAFKVRRLCRITATFEAPASQSAVS